MQIETIGATLALDFVAIATIMGLLTGKVFGGSG